MGVGVVGVEGGVMGVAVVGGSLGSRAVIVVGVVAVVVGGGKLLMRGIGRLSLWTWEGGALVVISG
jgi:hypothetical protein